MKFPRLLSALGSAVIIALAAGPVHAQSWPTKPIRLLVGSPPGGPSDITARTFADQLGRRIGQPVVVENRPGAGNNLAAGAAARADADGTTLVLSPDTVLTVNPLVYTTGDFNAARDLVNISVIASFSQMLVCNPSAGVRSVSELVAKAKTSPMMYASGGPGVPGHLASEMLLEQTKVRMEHVPYRGPAPATQAVLAGEVACGFLATPTVLPHVKSGRLVALAVSSEAPSALAPDVPTLAKALNQPGLDVSFRLVLQAAKGTPAPIVAEIEKHAAEIMKQAEVRDRLKNYDLTAVGSSSAQAQQVMNAEMKRWEPVVKRLGLKTE
ncbi:MULTISPECIES: Bug family tripartite tricarboxylate transporter substrate binding protein [Hydrogenophaga]|jgi:tripartite-type tricarboxylate transporter receptor subunit TctC|uniref:Extracytoplasmic binding receptor n=1 Tax=Hydrogenophaga intermedia TaxID=65786 RepID=A0A1L1PNB3_HYDIT|nr:MULTISPECIES: tripartite tricarboxylate transporter substrate-binding protein [Hydrogenophaga]AOS79318.1 receptor [Hydrogenophaga sp. PBC]TMU72865.1 receptor [Hydrogenophaga intermedia]CDN90294.1 Extracytoplasmic binding receptor [Hydrogenophaga intermedia]